MEPPTKNAKTTHVLEAMVTEILARLPLRSIFRFKSVCKTWKSTLESKYFRRLFLSVHQNSSSLWSLFHEAQELIRFGGRETWFLQQYSASYKRFQNNQPAFTDNLLLTEGSDNRTCFVGNPVLQQWLKIPPPPVDDPTVIDFGLVTRVDEDDVVLSFKVICLVSVNDHDMSVFVYSSETGIWTSKIIHCPDEIIYDSYSTMGGAIYLTALYEPGTLVAHDFYSDSDQFRVLHCPDHSVDNNSEFRRAMTTSGKYLMYIRTLAQEEQTLFKVWRLNNISGDEPWQLLWEVGIPIIGSYVPIAMNPFDSGIVYLWSQQDHHVVSCDLRTRKHSILSEEDQDCFIYQSVCEKSMDEIWESVLFSDYEKSVWLTQLVLPRWMESVPRPPQVEMIDTTSLLSYVTSIQREDKKEE